MVYNFDSVKLPEWAGPLVKAKCDSNGGVRITTHTELEGVKGLELNREQATELTNFLVEVYFEFR